MRTQSRGRYLDQSEWLSPTNIDNSFLGTQNTSAAITDWIMSTGQPGDLFRLRTGFYYIPQGIRIGKPCRLDLNGSWLLTGTTDGSEYAPLWDDWDEDATWPLKRVAVLVAADDVTITNSHPSTARVIGAARTINFTGGFTELPRGCIWSALLEGQHAIRVGGAATNIDRTFIDLRNIALELCHGDGVYLNDNTSNTTIVGVNNGEQVVGGSVSLVAGVWYQVGSTGATISGTDWAVSASVIPGIHHMGRHGIATDFTINGLTVRDVSIWQIRRAIIDLEPSGVGDTQTNIELDGLETGAKELLWLAAAGPRSISNLWIHDCVSYDWMSIDTVNASATARHDTWLIENNRGAGIRHGVAWELDRIDGLQALSNYQPVNVFDEGIDPGDSTSITISPAEGVQFPKGAPARLPAAAGVANPVTKGP